eukprot:3574742-Alexandrium_andersonii.AAC.1
MAESTSTKTINCSRCAFAGGLGPPYPREKRLWGARRRASSTASTSARNDDAECTPRDLRGPMSRPFLGPH